MRSRTDSSSAFSCRLDSPVAMMKKSRLVETSRRSSTVTSLARLSSSASMISCTAAGLASLSGAPGAAAPEWLSVKSSPPESSGFRGSGIRVHVEHGHEWRNARGAGLGVRAEHEFQLVFAASEWAHAVYLLFAHVQQRGVVIGVGPTGLRGYEPGGGGVGLVQAADHDGLLRHAQFYEAIQVPVGNAGHAAAVRDEERGVRAVHELARLTAEGLRHETVDLHRVVVDHPAERRQTLLFCDGQRGRGGELEVRQARG